MRPAQVDRSREMYKEKSEPNKMNQLLTGQGKTSVILPTLALQYLLRRSRGRVVVVLPEHMMRETGQKLSQTVAPALRFLSEPLHQVEHERFVNPPRPKVIPAVTYMSDTAAKAFLLSEGRNPGKLFAGALVIMDEFDSLYNPMTSTFNVPVGKELLYQPSKLMDETLKIRESEDEFQEELEEEPEQKQKANKLLMKKMERMSEEMVYNQHYGFSHTNPFSLVTVPYEFANKPSEGSKFSDEDLLYLTTFAALFQIRNEDLAKRSSEWVRRTMLKLLNDQIAPNAILNRFDMTECKIV